MTYQGNRLASADVLPGFDVESGSVAVKCRDSAAIVELDRVAIAATASCGANHAARRSEDRASLLRCDINARVKLLRAVDGVGALAVAA